MMCGWATGRGEEDSLQRVVVRFASTTGEDNLAGFAAQEAGNLCPRLLNGFPRRLPRPVITRRIPERRIQHRLHSNGNLGRYRRARIEIKVDAHSAPWSEPVYHPKSIDGRSCRIRAR